MTNGLKVGLAGVGTVGGGLVKLLAARGDTLASRAGRPIELVAVSTLEHRKNPDVDISPFRLVNDPVALAKDPGIDVFVELMGGEGGVAKESVEAALRAGKHVVTANKALLALYGNEIFAAASEKGVMVAFEAAVA
ncbi:MAG: homoserine dehydrogenase, partial [Methyloceanibacter sp.]|nr:homoserine dehydrogenase [Methyloceanibacter sp.]